MFLEGEWLSLEELPRLETSKIRYAQSVKNYHVHIHIFIYTSSKCIHESVSSLESGLQ